MNANIQSFDAQLEEHLFKKLNKKRAEKGKGPIGKKLVDKVAKVGKKLGADKALVTPLVPFKKAMKKRLAKMGVTPKSNKMIDVATAFFENVVQKKNLEEGRENIEPVTITLIVTGIVSFFKALKEKKEKTADEMELEADANESVAEADEMDEEEIEAEVTAGKSASAKSSESSSSSSSGSFMGLDTTTLILILAAIVAVYFLTR